MFRTTTVAQPGTGANLEMISKILAEGGVDRIDLAAAYATESGVDPLVSAMENGLGAAWTTTPKRWILAFDYFRTQPAAADRLSALPASTVKIHDANAVLDRKGAPRTPFHPKTFLFSGPNDQRLFTGSGNLSRSGLLRGHEVGVLLDHQGQPTKGSQSVADAIAVAQAWFEDLWAGAAEYNTVAARYRRLFESEPNLSWPTPTEDDIADFELKQRGLTPQDLTKLRVCRHLWIDEGVLTKNRGANLPGNQVMMKRMTRVFFGVPARDVPANWPLATLEISLLGQTKDDCSLTFSDNTMDKLTLPVPDAIIGSYDNKTLLFSRVGARRFTVETVAGQARAACKKASKAIGAHFRMSGAKAREWGVY